MLTINNDTALAESVAKLSRNTPATAMLTKMMQQREQMDRLIQQYREAAGPDSADAALAKDPFVAARGFVESLKEVATSIKGMPQAVGILNSLTGGLQRFASALREQDGLAQSLLAGTTALGAFAGVKAMKGIFDLATAGTSLKEAAAALKGAAATMNGGKDSTVVAGDGSKSADLFGRAGKLMTMLNFVTAALDGPTNLQDFEKLRQANAERDKAANKWLEDRNLAPSEWYKPTDVYAHATEIMNRRQQMEGATTPYNPNTPGIGNLFGNITNLADAAGRQIQDALSVTATPQVNTAQLREAVALANQLKSVLSGIGASVASAHSSVSKALGRSFSDHGVKP